MSVQIINGDALGSLKGLPDESVHCCVTSPPYFNLRDYEIEGQIGQERTPEEYIAKLVEVCGQVRRVLRPDGSLWLNLADSFDGDKRLRGVPWRVAFALQAEGWILRADVIWRKPNPMPINVKDSPVPSHEHIFHFVKSPRYFYDWRAVVEPFSDARQGRDGSKKARERNRGGRTDGFTKPNGIDPSANGGRLRRDVWEFEPRPDWYWLAVLEYAERHFGAAAFASFVAAFNDEALQSGEPDVWTIPVAHFKEAHFAVMPEKLAEVCIKAGCPEGGTVIDPFAGTGTTGRVAQRLNRRAILIELNPDYIPMIEGRCAPSAGLPFEVIV